MFDVLVEHGSGNYRGHAVDALVRKGLAYYKNNALTLTKEGNLFASAPAQSDASVMPKEGEGR